MFSHEAHYLIRKEQYKDLRRNAARHQLINTALLGRPNNGKSIRRMAGWFGSRMIKWGAKLQHQDQHQTAIQHGS